MNRFKKWWEWHRAFLWLVFTTFPIVWVSHPEFQSLLPAKLVSCIAPFAGAIGFLSEMVTQVGRKKSNVPTNNV